MGTPPSFAPFLASSRAAMKPASVADILEVDFDSLKCLIEGESDDCMCSCQVNGVFSIGLSLTFCDADKTFGRSERTLDLERHDSFSTDISSMLLKCIDRCRVPARCKQQHALWANILPYWRNRRDEDTIGASSCIGQVQADSEIRSKQDPAELYRLTA
jgi:hypothetical protein